MRRLPDVLYLTDSVLWIIVYITGALVTLTLSCVEDWEECEFDKVGREIRQRRWTALDKIIHPIVQKDDVVVSSMDDLTSVYIDTNELRYFGKGYKIILQFQDELGISLGLTGSYIFGNSGDHESIAEKIRRFVDINKIRDKWLEREAASDSYLDDNDSSTDDDFEKVDPSQITEDYEKNDDN